MNMLTRLENRWNPFKDMEDLQRRLFGAWDRLPMDRYFDRDENVTATEWLPSVDISEDAKEYLIKVEVPGIEKDQVKVTVENGVLTITGERKFEKEEKDKKYHRVERSYGSFVRSFTLPENTDGSKVRAEYKDGVLKVHLEKDEKAKPKSIDVKVA